MHMQRIGFHFDLRIFQKGAALQPGDALPVRQAVGEVALVDGERVLNRVHAPVRLEAVVHQRVFFQQIQLVVQPHRLARLHGLPIATDAAKGIRVGADQKINLRRTQHTRQAEMAAALNRRIVVAVGRRAKEIDIPGQIHQIAKERAGQLLAVGLGLHHATKLAQPIRAQFGQALVIVNHVLLASRIAKVAMASSGLLTRQWHISGVKGQVLVVPGLAQEKDIVLIFAAQPSPKVLTHWHAVVTKPIHLIGIAFDPFPRRTGCNLIGDHSVI